ncbi:hypothetical protein TI39_contig412g00022 [Zymoseptoria brevis]|uniref:JmjC domain-containing protein n=1 Tax=Zymoseptoria brevis TaxID=1047168 RepID=A0A0F4GLZ1_9PEZI|nr:hypothetical protein TI39_contig412g00022 [Zymoseptoria brevis]
MTTQGTLDKATQAFVQKLHTVWAQQAPPSAYVKLRDSLLSQRDQVDTRIVTLCSVAKIACPAGLECNVKWRELLSLATEIEEKKGKRSNETNRLRSLAFVATLWSPEVVFHYGWDKVGQVQMSAIRVCATRYPRFKEDLCPRLNCVLLQRHCEAITKGRLRTLDQATLQLRDLSAQLLAATTPDDNALHQWVTNMDGSVAVDDIGTLLNEVRPDHYHMYLLQTDRYGLLTARANNSTSAVRQHASLSDDCTPITRTDEDLGDMLDRVQQSSSGSRHSSSDAMSSRPSTSTPSGLTPDDTPVPTVDHFRESFFGCDMDSPSDSSSPYDSHSPTDNNSSAEPTNNSPASLALPTSTEYSALLDNGAGTEREPGAISPDGSQGMARHSGNPRTDRIGLGREEFSDVAMGNAEIVHDRSNSDDSPTQPLYPMQTQSLFSQSEVQDIVMMEDLLHHPGTTATPLCDVPDGQQELPGVLAEPPAQPSSWLKSDARHASIFTQRGSELSYGRAQSEYQADVLHFTSEEFITAAQDGRIFRKPLVIKERFSDSNIHTAETLALQLQERSPRLPTLHAKQFDKVQSAPVSLDKIAEGLRTGKHWDDVAGQSYNGAAMLKFRNITNGTWLRVLDGTAVWMFVPEDEMAMEWSTFRDGNDWMPDGRQRLVFLQQDDVLLLPPGVKIVQAMYSSTTTVLEGGLFWDKLSVMQTLRCISWELENLPSTQSQDAISDHLPRIVEELVALVTEQPDHFRGLWHVAVVYWTARTQETAHVAKQDVLVRLGA